MQNFMFIFGCFYFKGLSTLFFRHFLLTLFPYIGHVILIISELAFKNVYIYNVEIFLVSVL